MITIGWVRMMSITVSPLNFLRSVHAYDRIVVTIPHIVHPRFKLNQAVDVRLTVGCPVHLADDAAQRKSALGAVAGQLLEHLEHPIRIEISVPKVGFDVGPELESPALLGGHRVNAHRGQPFQVVVALLRIDDVNRLVATFKSSLNEWEQYAIGFVVAVEKCTHMTRCAELGAGKGNGCSDLPHDNCLSL